MSCERVQWPWDGLETPAGLYPGRLALGSGRPRRRCCRDVSVNANRNGAVKAWEQPGRPLSTTDQ